MPVDSTLNELADSLRTVQESLEAYERHVLELAAAALELRARAMCAARNQDLGIVDIRAIERLVDRAPKS